MRSVQTTLTRICIDIESVSFVRKLRLGKLGFFPSKIRWSPKKKKKRSFRPISQIQTFEGGLFFYGGGGGLFSVFHKKSASKAQKTCDFAYFTSQWGGSSPPPPGYATGYSDEKLIHIAIAAIGVAGGEGRVSLLIEIPLMVKM